MEKKLLLLGVLRSQEMHGYQLSEHLDNHYPLPIENILACSEFSV